MFANHSTQTTGVIAAIVAFMTWGLYPLFFKQLSSVASGEILAHRIVWSCLILLAVFLIIPSMRRNLQTIWKPRNIAIALASALLISVNWFCFIYAVNTDRILEASLGYFLIPVVNAVLGAMFAGEVLNNIKKLAVAVAFSGIFAIFFVSGILPYIALAIAFSFGSYGLVRKLSPLDSPSGLFLETLLLSPLAVGYLIVFGVSLTSHTPGTMTFLVLAGVMTLIPLLSMVIAARRLEYVTLGFLQYITPVMQLIIAVGIYAEPFTTERMIAFGTAVLAAVIFACGAMLPFRRLAHATTH